MYAKRPATTLFQIVVILVTAVMMGCHEPPESSLIIDRGNIFDYPVWKFPPAKGSTVVTTTIEINAACEASPDPADTWPGHFVEFCNNSQCPVSIVFEEHSLFGQDDLTLDIGECVSLRVMSGTDRTNGYLYEVYCECAMVGNSTPQINVSPPPPPTP